MSGETNLSKLIKNMTPELNEGAYVFVCLEDSSIIPREDIIGEFKEKEGITLIIRKEKADKLKLDYEFIAAWITLTTHSSFDAVGLTAAFSAELTKHNISCNVIAGFYHDHIFVDHQDAEKAIAVLKQLSNSKL